MKAQLTATQSTFVAVKLINIPWDNSPQTQYSGHVHTGLNPDGSYLKMASHLWRISTKLDWTEQLWTKLNIMTVARSTDLVVINLKYNILC